MITRFYPYSLTLQAPLLITSLEGDPNSARSLDFIPGSSIRGAFASRLDPNKATFKQYILSGDVCFLNAYPTVHGQRALPVPVSFRQEKYGDTVHDLALYSGQPESGSANAWPDEQLKGTEASFLSLDQADLHTAFVTLESRVHQQRDRSAGRAYTYRDPVTGAEEARGTIFIYEAIEAGQQFQGIVAISGQGQNEIDKIWGDLKCVVGDRLSLGRSRNARYGGGAVIAWGTPRCYETVDATGVIRHDLQCDACFCVFLTSDYIGRDAGSGQSDPTAFRQDIIRRIGGNRVEVLHTRWAFRPVGGFNRKWGIQLPQTLALRAGSLLVLKAKSAITYDGLAAIEQTGLGERCPEGFGRVIFLEAPRKTRSIKTAQPDAPEAPKRDAPNLIKTMQRRIIMDAFDHRITKAAADRVRNADRIPSPSLLGRLRVPLRQGPPGLETLRTWLNDDRRNANRLRPPAMNQLNDCRIDNDNNERITLAQWIRDRVNAAATTSDVGKALEIQRVIQKNYIESVEAAKTVLDTDTAQQLTVRLIDEVLALLARRQRLASRGGQHAGE